MPQRKIEIELFEHQDDFLYSEYPSTGLVAGFGSGKSYVGTIKASKKLTELKCNVGYYLPTYQLIKDIAFENFTNILDKFGVDFKLNESDKVFKTSYGNIFLRSMDSPFAIVGYETGYALIDEADILPTDKMNKAYKAIVARNRIVLPKGFVNSTDMVSTPEGFKFLYDYYVKNGNKRRKLIQANTLDNTTLPQSYIDNLYDTYPKEQLEAYMKGQFVNLTTGTVYRDFDRKKNIDNTKEAGSNILYVGMDFNITKMACTISIKEGNIRYVIDEIVDEYDTSDIVKEIQKRYPNHRIFVYPDAAGAARNTSGKSDHDILRKAGFKVNVPSKNPFIRDRINSVNKEFADQTTFINSNRCPSLVSALEKQAYNKNGEPDKSTGHDHCFVGNTIISTIHGDKKIQDICKNDYVLTPNGYKKVLIKWNNGKQQTNKYLIQLDTLSLYLHCTPNHKIKTNEGWIQISQLQSGMTVSLFNSTKASHLNYNQEKDISITEAIRCMYGYGKKRTIKKFQKDFMYTTRIITHGIMSRQTLKLSKAVNTHHIMQRNVIEKIQNGVKNFTKKELRRLRNGTLQKKVLNGILNMVKEHGKKEIQKKKNALFAETNMKHTLKTEVNSVQKNANQNLGEIQVLTMKKENALIAQKNLLQTNILKQNFVQERVVQNISIIKEDYQTVYDLTVEDEHCYFANGMLVHNCLDALGYEIHNSKGNQVKVRSSNAF